MIRHPAAALAWELWHPHRAGLVGLAVVTPVAAWLAGTVAPGLLEARLVHGGLPLLFLCGLLYIVVAFSYSEFSQRSLRTGFPDHVLRLPVATWLLAWLPLVLGTVALVLHVLVWAKLGLLRFEPAPTAVVLAAGIAVSWMLLVTWGLDRTPVIAGATLLVVIGAAGLGLVTLASEPGTPTLISRSAAMVLVGLLLVMGVGLSWLSVHRARGGQRLIGRSAGGGVSLPGFSLPPKMADGASAQFRYEWRTFGWILPVAALAIGMVSLLLPKDGEAAVAPVVLMLGVFIYMTAVMGLEMAKSHFRKDDHAMTAFWATRPLSDGALARAKLRLAGTTILVATVCLLVPLVAGWLLAGRSAEIQLLWQAVVRVEGGQAACAGATALLLLMLVCWILNANLLTACLTGHRLLGSRMMLALGPLFLLVAGGIHGLSQLPWVRALLLEHGLLLATLPGLLLLVLMAWIEPPQRWHRVVPGPVLLAAGALLAWLLWGAMHLRLIEGVRPAAIILSVDLVLAALLPFVAAPIALGHNRHRVEE